MSSRKPNALEQKIHQAALASNDKTLSQKEIDALARDQTERTAALNFLLAAGLLKPLQSAGGKLSFRAVVKQELEIKKDLSPEESLVLSHIQVAGNEGIWTKHLKVKTELHQTVIDRCLKSLTQKQLVKALKGSVQYPTRKIYMLFHLEPSVEMTGGPWYTDKELDTEFIKLLSAACLKFIRDRSFPRSKSGDNKQRVLYSITAAPPYPTAVQVQTFLNKSRITETQLSVEHVEMLLNVLVIDGEVEKIPALGAALWESSLRDDDEADSSDDGGSKSKSKKRKRSEGGGKRKKRKKSVSSDSEDDSDVDSSKKSKSKSKSKKRSKQESSSETEPETDTKRNRKGKKKRSRDSEESDEQTANSDDESPKRKGKSKKRKSRGDSSEIETESEDESPRKSKARSKPKSKSKRDSSPTGDHALDDAGLLGGAHVYRAIHPERMLGFGLSQAPCGRCPTFGFCKDEGPVNPGECVYFGDWLNAAEIKLE